jgi:hypothetical protein
MANHHVHFTLGSHIQFGSLDFLYMGWIMLVDLVFLSGSNERVADLSPATVEGKCGLPSPAESPDSPANIVSIMSQ